MIRWPRKRESRYLGPKLMVDHRHLMFWLKWAPWLFVGPLETIPDFIESLLEIFIFHEISLVLTSIFFAIDSEHILLVSS